MRRVWFVIVFAVSGCSGTSAPNGTYTVETSSCSHFHPTGIIFDGAEVNLIIPVPGYPTAQWPGKDPKIDGSHVSFGLTWSVNVGDTNIVEHGEETYALDVADTQLTGSGDGAYEGNWSELPFSCSGAFNVHGERAKPADAGVGI